MTALVRVVAVVAIVTGLAVLMVESPLGWPDRALSVLGAVAVGLGVGLAWSTGVEEAR